MRVGGLLGCVLGYIEVLDDFVGGLGFIEFFKVVFYIEVGGRFLYFLY